MNLWQRAQDVLPGGVNSPVRAFRSVGGEPVFMESARGAWLRAKDGREFVDYVGSWGPAILGHGHPAALEAIRGQMDKGMAFGCATELEVLFAEYLRERLPSLEMLRLVNSGTEATLAAIRLARGFTGRAKIIKFKGCYHGHGDSFLIEAGSGAHTHGVPSSSGVSEAVAQDTLVAEYNDLSSVQSQMEAHPEQVAAVILEPIVGNMGVLIPAEGFLSGLRELCDQHGVLLIFDEVMTGFRVGPQGAQGLYQIRPDLTTFGKIIGGGLPVGAYGGRRDVMSKISPVGPVYQAGTLSGHPWAVQAGWATLRELENPEIYAGLEQYGAALAEGLRALGEELGVPLWVNRVGSMLTVFFHPGPVLGYAEAAASDTVAFGRFFNGMLERGVHLPPSQFEAWFISAAHGELELERTLSAARGALEDLLK